MFDNLYWLGTRQHSSWALQTSAGIIIIDTNFAWATEPEIIEGLTKLGLNPRDIKYVIISHAHGDHDQGAAELQKRYGAKVVMGRPTGRPPEATRHRRGRRAEARRRGGAGGHEADPGRYHHPYRRHARPHAGHAVVCLPGEGSGRTVMVAYSGGTLTGAFGTDGARWDEYIASQRKIAKAAADAGASVILSNHSEYDGAYTKARLSRRRVSQAKTIRSSSAPTACSATSR